MAQPGSRQRRSLHAGVVLALGLLLSAPAGRPPLGTPIQTTPDPGPATDRGAADYGRVIEPNLADHGPADPSRAADAAADSATRPEPPEPTAEYHAAEAHGRDAIAFVPGARVSVPFVPRADDAWEVDGAAPRTLPPGVESGAQSRAATGSSADGDVELASATLPATGVSGAAVARVSPSGLRREVFGFLPYWELNARSTVLDWRTLSTVAYFSVGCQADGSLARRDADGSSTIGWAGWASSKMTSVIEAAHRHGARVVLTVTCFAWSSAGAAAQASLLGSSLARASLARQIAAAVRDRGADGVNLDFEPILAGHGGEFTALVRSTRAALNAVHRGYELTFDALPSIGNQPIAEATAPGGADAVLIMGYDYRTANARDAGSIAPLSGPDYDLSDTIQAYTSVVGPSKIILGVPWYGRAWSTPNPQPHAENISSARNGDVAEPTYAQAAELLAANGRHWDAVEQTAWTAYRKRTCTSRFGCVTVWRELYVDDAASLRLRYDLINRAGLRGVGIWALGFDDGRPEMRAAIASKFLADRTPPVAGIVALPERSRDEGFRVGWTAYDDSPIRGYDVQVSIDGRAWRPWLTRTTGTSAIYPGANGQTYTFRVRAADVHGNVSSWGSASFGSLATPKAFAVGGFATVLTDGLRLRASPSTLASVMTRLRAGDAVRVIGGPTRANGDTWYEVAGPLRQWPPVDAIQVGGWIAVSGNGVVNAAPRRPVSVTTVDAGLTGLALNGGGTRVLSPNGDGRDDVLRLAWVNHRAFDGLALRIFGPDGTLVGERPLGPGLLGAGPRAFAWDGRLGGSLLAPGTYVVQLQGRAGSAAFNAPSARPVSGPGLQRWGFVVGNLAPTAVLSFQVAGGPATRGRSINYSMVFAAPVSDLTTSDLTRSGTAVGCVVGRPAGRGRTWWFAVTGCGQGTLIVSLRPGAVVDAVGNRGPVSKVTAQRLVIDRTRPATSTPRVSLTAGVALPPGATGLPATVSWATTDAGGSGIAGTDVRVSRDGGPFADLSAGLTNPSLAVTLAAGHRYRFEVRSFDRAGNASAWVVGATISAAITQEAGPAISSAGGWASIQAGRYLGGAALSTVSAGASVRYTFTGRSIALVSLRAADCGALRVYVDGALVATVDTHAVTLTARWVAWSRTWARSGTHTVKLVAVGTAGRPRADVDAFEALR